MPKLSQEVLDERDRLVDAERDGDWRNKPPISASLKAEKLKIAIQNIRIKRKAAT